ncbi:SDR family NAD(P)-dependent oxidoreductase [Streptomyces mirabilis]|uniref:SDR family NAD(P)-dependent oxidoreductase n=1 Tax=Streptomyces mirabilis TaxID=68239 RepID=UPI0036AC9AF5
MRLSSVKLCALCFESACSMLRSERVDGAAHHIDDGVGMSAERAVVVGVTGTLGGAAARKLMSRGIRVIGVARDAERLDALAAEHKLLTPCPADIADDSAIDTIAAAVDGPLRMIFMGAGLPVRGSAETAAPGDFATAINVKIGGLVRLLRATGPQLGAGSRIVVLSGYHATEPRPHEAMPGVINAALHNFVRQLSDLWGPREVTVHAISPGAIDSPRIRRIAETAAAERGVDLATQLESYTAEASLKKFVSVDAIAWAVGLLLDPEADALHGSVLAMDGGRLRSIL